MCNYFTRYSIIITKFIFLPIIMILFLSSYNNIFSQPFMFALQDPIEGIATTTYNNVADSFNCMTHYSENDNSISLNILYSKYQYLADNENSVIKGDSLNGYGIGSSFGYALTNDWMITSTFSFNYINGEMIIPLTDGSETWFLEGNNKLLFFQIGLGYDLFNDSSSWSLPILFGVHISKYNMDTHLSYPIDLGKPEMDVIVNELIYGYNFGIILSKKIDIFDLSFKISPYILFIEDCGEPEIKATYTETKGSFTQGDSTSFKGFSNGTAIPGIKLLYISKESPISYSLSISGLFATKLDFYSDEFLDGQKSTTVSFSLIYNNF